MHLLAALNEYDTLNTINTMTSDIDDDISAFFIGGMIMVFLVIGIMVLAAIIVVTIAQWKIFEKAGKPGWAALIPIYSQWVLMEIIDYPGWLSLLVLIPQAGIVPLVLSILVAINLPKKFGKESSFGIGLFLLPVVFYPMLGFGNAEYVEKDKEEVVVEERVIETTTVTETKTEE